MPLEISRESLAKAAAAWQTRGRRPDDLAHAGFQLIQAADQPDADLGSGDLLVAAYVSACMRSHEAAADRERRNAAWQAPPAISQAEILGPLAEAVRANDVGAHDRALRYGLAAWAAAKTLGLQPPAAVFAQLGRAAFHDMLLTRFHIDRWPQAIDLSPDGERVAVTYVEAGCVQYDARSGEPVAWARRENLGKAGPVAFLPESRDLLFVEDDGALMLWEADANPRPIAWAPGLVRHMAISRDGLRVALADNFGEFLCLDLSDGGECFSAAGRGNELRLLAFDHHGRLLAVGADAQVRSYARDGAETVRLALDARDCLAALDPSGTTLGLLCLHPASGTDPVHGLTLDTEWGEPHWIRNGLAGMEFPVAATWAGRDFYAVDSLGRISGLDGTWGRSLPVRPGWALAPPAGGRLAIVDEDVLSLWRPDRCVFELEPLTADQDLWAVGFQRDVQGRDRLVVSPAPAGDLPSADGAPLPVIGGGDATRLIELDRGEGSTLVALAYSGAIRIGDDAVSTMDSQPAPWLRPVEDTDLVVSDDGRWLVAQDGWQWALVDLKATRLVRLSEAAESGSSMAVGMFRGRPVVAASKANGDAELLDAETGVAMHRLAGMGGWREGFIRRERLILVSGQEAVVVDLESGERLHRTQLGLHFTTRPSVSPDGLHLVVGDGVFDLVSGMRLASTPHSQTRAPAAWSADGRWLAVPGQGVSLYDARWLGGLTGDALVEAVCRERLWGAPMRLAEDGRDALTDLPADPVGLCRIWLSQGEEEGHP